MQKEVKSWKTPRGQGAVNDGERASGHAAQKNGGDRLRATAPWIRVNGDGGRLLLDDVALHRAERAEQRVLGVGADVVGVERFDEVFDQRVEVV